MSTNKKLRRYGRSPQPDPGPGRVCSNSAEKLSGMRVRFRTPRLSWPDMPGVKDPLRERRIKVAHQRRQAFYGVLPPPDALHRYGEIIADAPERILQILEADSAHLHRLQMTIVEAKKADNRRVHWMAYSLIACGYGISVLFASMNKDVLGGVILTTTIIGTVSVFMNQRHDAQTAKPEKDAPSE